MISRGKGDGKFDLHGRSLIDFALERFDGLFDVFSGDFVKITREQNGSFRIHRRCCCSKDTYTFVFLLISYPQCFSTLFWPTFVPSRYFCRFFVPLLIPTTTTHQPQLDRVRCKDVPSTPSARGSRVPPCPTLNPCLTLFFFRFLARVPAACLILSGSAKSLESFMRSCKLSRTRILLSAALPVSHSTKRTKWVRMASRWGRDR